MLKPDRDAGGDSLHSLLPSDSDALRDRLQLSSTFAPKLLESGEELSDVEGIKMASLFDRRPSEYGPEPSRPFLTGRGVSKRLGRPELVDGRDTFDPVSDPADPHPWHSIEASSLRLKVEEFADNVGGKVGVEGRSSTEWRAMP